MRIAIAAALLIVACGGATKPSGKGTGTGTGTGTSQDVCGAAVANARTLYEAEAKATDQATHDPSYVDDNVAMVAKDCAQDPAHVALCARGAASVAALEKDCLVPLDEEGTEGERTP